MGPFEYSMGSLRYPLELVKKAVKVGGLINLIWNEVEVL